MITVGKSSIIENFLRFLAILREEIITLKTPTKMFLTQIKVLSIEIRISKLPSRIRFLIEIRISMLPSRIRFRNLLHIL